MTAKTYIYIAAGTVALTTIGYFAWKKWFKKPVVESEDKSGGGGGGEITERSKTAPTVKNKIIINAEKRPQSISVVNQKKPTQQVARPNKPASSKTAKPTSVTPTINKR